MTEQAYEREGSLQELIAQHPEMLGSDDRPLMLVKREAHVQQEQDSGLSLDHLYLDARGIPTLVEVKQGTNNEVRRKVVAQMLDYAANARRSFSVDRMTAWLEEDAARRGTSPDELLTTELGIQDPDAFWSEVRRISTPSGSG